MFYAKKIISIQPQDRVLEIGPGSTPHRRADAFLELRFDSTQEQVAQRGGVAQDGHFSDRPVHYYNGGRFPFDDGQFDYVICSHVIEHVNNPADFLQEVFRISTGRGYLEYPMITYEYLYNFSVHLHFIKFDAERKILHYLPKQETDMAYFSPVSALFNKTLVNGWDELCAANHKLFFEGFEYHQPFAIEKSNNIEALCPPSAYVEPKKKVRKLVGQILNHTGL